MNYRNLPEPFLGQAKLSGKKPTLFYKKFSWNWNIFLQYFRSFIVKPAVASVNFYLLSCYTNIFFGLDLYIKGQAVEASWKLEELASLIKEERLAIVRVNFRGLEVRGHTDKKENQIYLIY